MQHSERAEKDSSKHSSSVAAASPSWLARSITGTKFEISHKKVAAMLGCPKDAAISPRLTRQIERATREISERIERRVDHRNYPLHVEGSRVHVAGKAAFRSRKLAMTLRPCESIHIYIVTLGREVDRFIDKMMNVRPNFGVVVDAAASIAAESMVDRLEESLSAQLPPWAALTLPFSPGHCDWSVAEQQQIFSLLPEKPAGVTLSPDLMMSPRKSISGVLGVGPVEATTESRNPCAACPRDNCAHRRCAYRRAK